MDGLREAGIIARERKDNSGDDEAASGFVSSSAAGGDKGDKKVNLEVGWLNSRSSKVGTDMEAELWAQAREFLEERKKASSGGNGNRDEDEEMMT